MEKARQFTLERPFFSFCAGGHLYELLKRLMKDIIGLRQRLTVVFARPLFVSLEDIDAACHELPKETHYKPEEFVAALLFPAVALESTQGSSAAGDADRPSPGGTG